MKKIIPSLIPLIFEDGISFPLSSYMLTLLENFSMNFLAFLPAKYRNATSKHKQDMKSQSTNW